MKRYKVDMGNIKVRPYDVRFETISDKSYRNLDTVGAGTAIGREERCLREAEGDIRVHPGRCYTTTCTETYHRRF